MIASTFPERVCRKRGFTLWILTRVQSLSEPRAASSPRRIRMRNAWREVREIGLTIVGLGMPLIALGVGQRSSLGDDKPRPDSHAPGSIAFREVAEPSGISFRFETGARGQHDLPEIMGGGVALFDAD